jgi:hypothetical protein
MRRVTPVVLFVFAVTLSGCGGKGDTVEVEGVVKGPDGKPLPNILVQFNPDKATGGKLVMSAGLTDEAGKYTLKAADGLPGAAAGPYRVVLIDNNLGTEDEPTGKAPAKKLVNRVPPAYMTASTTPLLVTVEPGKTYDLKVERR